MNISENQIRSLNESLDIVNLDRIKFAELFLSISKKIIQNTRTYFPEFN
ncbi:hypothetical protein LEP1GSC116_0600 [Leptospira interrogans serovar Icterohaemorrhagiae str. Verdun HP]|uniref:Uncharacterized protein n=1 Tax=Leptospira interrogans serovar Icterohaemorrhagiae str. Verdun HP TaxID=1049910 RepID=M6RLQ5_LEPIR|nr:hypothetical protein LEP1GSC116_0600 [Leptospira interrogans serovar Icterohaemorrhagiae str. Verdun HP]